MKKASQLVETLRDYQSCAVAFSAGVDSAVVIKAAHLALGPRSVAVTGDGPALAEGELAQARDLAARIGIRHEVVATDEIHDSGYRANAPDRCFHCKTELYTHVERVAERLKLAVIANGANIDDRGDFRPGMRAAVDFQVRSPLIECGFDKQTVRDLAQHWLLPVWDKPAAPCLASRLAYGVAVTPERLRRVDLAEQFLRKAGFAEVRVRCLENEVASIEVPQEEIARLMNTQTAKPIQQRLLELGFSSVNTDSKGLRSGSMNSMLTVETLQKWKS